MPNLMQHFIPHATVRAPRSELWLRQPDGSPWVLRVTPGVERFIGHYPRLPGIVTDGPLLSYRTAA
jgi:hypothetical protein